MLRRKRLGVLTAVSTLCERSVAGGACQHLRLVAPFSWLERHDGWAPLDYALKLREPNRRQLRMVRRANRVTFGCAYPETVAQALTAAAETGVALAPASGATAVLFLREADPRFVEEAARRARKDGVPLIYDTDDLLLDVPRDSPVAAHYDAIRPLLTRWIKMADHVTVANEALAAELAGLNPSISILPSFLDVELWGVSPIPAPDDGPVRIGFWGTGSHIPDLRRLTAGFRHLKSRYGRRVRFQFMGCCDSELLALDDVAVGGYVTSYASYAAATRNCRLDIAIAPLVANRFNRCKSPIKFFEYSIRGACGVYADLDPYWGVVRHGENGFLVGDSPDDWISALERLVDEPALRHRMACRAQADVLAHHTLDHHIWRWREIYGPGTGGHSEVPAGKQARRFQPGPRRPISPTTEGRTETMRAD